MIGSGAGFATDIGTEGERNAHSGANTKPPMILIESVQQIRRNPLRVAIVSLTKAKCNVLARVAVIRPGYLLERTRAT